MKVSLGILAGLVLVICAVTAQSVQHETEEVYNNLTTTTTHHNNNLTVNNNNNNDDTFFCQETSQPMTMFMDGFHWNTAIPDLVSWWRQQDDIRSSRMCLSYLVPSWQLSDSGKFWGACVYSFLLAFLLEALSAARTWSNKQQTKLNNTNSIMNNRYSIATTAFQRRLQTAAAERNGNNTQQQQRRRRQQRRRHHLFLTVLYAVQGSLGYVVMLLTMAFSVEILFSVVFGLMTGHVVFLQQPNDHDDENISARDQSMNVMQQQQEEEDLEDDDDYYNLNGGFDDDEYYDEEDDDDCDSYDDDDDHDVEGEDDQDYVEDDDNPEED